ncbi:DUF1799 domain-containing protein [Sphingomonas sp. NCPPB 2930]
MDADLQTQCTALGIDIDQLVPQEARQPEEVVFEVWPEHWAAVEVFQCSRWDLQVGMAGAVYLGFESASVDLAMRSLGIRRKDVREVFLQVKTMEEAGLQVLNKR